MLDTAVKGKGVRVVKREPVTLEEVRKGSPQSSLFLLCGLLH